MSDKELYESRLATTDEHGHRVYIHPEDIKGKWKNRRTAFYWFLILVYLILPWIYVDGKQWILLNITKREFIIFGHMFYGHDGPLILFLIFGFVVFIAFVTSLWGRVWCGWACPQTVFIDTIFRKIERLIEGNARKRKALDKQKYDVTKLTKKSFKWFLFFLVSLHIVHSFLGYFVGTRNLVNISMHAPSENWSLFVTMLVITGIILFDFGWFKEQFCIIACPYGRFQSVVMDEESLVVAYDYNRGEPRRKKGLTKDQEGDCISCNHCVKACPTGIDIRQGTQMECIACTMCIDACDTIMSKIKKEPGLIRYTSEKELLGKPRSKFRLRSAVYLILLFAMGVGLTVSLNKRQDLKHKLLRSSSTPYQVVKKGDDISISNFYKLKLYQTGGNKENLKIIIDNKDQAEVSLTTPFKIIEMDEDSVQVPLFFNFKKEILTNGKKKITIHLINAKTNLFVKTMEVDLVGPIR